MKNSILNTFVFLIIILLDVYNSIKIKEQTKFLDKKEYNIDNLSTLTKSVMNDILNVKQRKISNFKVKNELNTEKDENELNEKPCNSHEETINICNGNKCIQKKINIDEEAINRKNQNEKYLNIKKHLLVSKGNDEDNLYSTEQEDNELGDESDDNNFQGQNKNNNKSNFVSDDNLNDEYTNNKNDIRNNINELTNHKKNTNSNSLQNWNNKTKNNENSLQNKIQLKTDKNNTKNITNNSLDTNHCNNKDSLNELKRKKYKDELKKLKMILDNPKFNSLINALSNNQKNDTLGSMNHSSPININIPTSNLAINEGKNPINKIKSQSSNDNKTISYITEKPVKSTTNINIEID